MNNRYKITYHARPNVNPAKPKRTTSFLNVTDTKTKQTKRFDFSKNLGEGTYGYVRLFVNGDHKIAVKALKEYNRGDLHHLSKEAAAEWQHEMENEYLLMREAYPDEPYFSLHHYRQTETGKGNIYDCRMTMPFITGMKLPDFAKQHIEDPREMAKLMLRVTEELQRLHIETGIIHGDAGGRNIMVSEHGDDYEIHLLDFGMAYRIDGYAKTNYEKSSASDTTSSDMAPERLPNRRLKARPSQDVYSLAKTFWKLIKYRDPEWRQQFLEQFPVIHQFIKDGSRDWKDRPELSEFIIKLESNLDWQLHLPEEISELTDELADRNFARAKRLLQNNPEQYTGEALAPLLHHLLLNQEYNLTEELMLLKTRIPLDILIHGNNCLHIAAANSSIDPDFLDTLLAYSPKNKLIATLNQENISGETVMHIAAAAGNAEVIRTLLKYQPNLLVKNADGKRPVDVAHPDVEPILRLFTFIADREQEHKHASKPRLFDSSNHRMNILSASRFLADIILNGDENDDEEEYEQHLDVIEETPELSKIYDSLTEKEILKPRDKLNCGVFGLFNLF